VQQLEGCVQQLEDTIKENKEGRQVLQKTLDEVTGHLAATVALTEKHESTIRTNRAIIRDQKQQLEVRSYPVL
jgi:hypothetical protein